MFIDSVSCANFDLDYLRQLRQDNPLTSLIFIYYTTKDGNFRSKQEYAHKMDLIIEVADGKDQVLYVLFSKLYPVLYY
ncbi:MAG: hypothetical protein NTW49_01670 [Bacteroidia bacterium]|nr:hypothetical protein [Bacteroidia bacterium]